MPNEQTLPEIVIAAAESQLGAPYVYGTWGLKPCTVALRKRYAGYNPSQKAITYKRCPVLSGKAKTCAGCKYQGMLAFDCRGFTHWCLKKADIDITGGYVARQWSDKNWDEKGTIDRMPDLVCCVFVKKGKKWKHTGLHIGGGWIIHCSGEVKRDMAVGGDNAWTHYAVPKGLYTDEQRRSAARKETTTMRTLKNGCQGDDVRALQEMLNALGHDCGEVDGIYGGKTTAAVRSYQQARGLTADGIAGPQTQMALAADAAKPKPVPVRDELPEDDDEVEAPTGLVALTHEKALRVLAALKEAQEIIEQALS